MARGLNRFCRLTGIIGVLLAVPPAAALPAYYGDLDADGITTVRDLSLLVNHLEAVTPLASELLPFADLTHDGVVDNADVDRLLEAVLARDPAEAVAPTWITVSPADHEADVNPARSIVVEFSRALAAATSVDNVVRVEIEGQSLPLLAELDAARRQLRLVPQNVLPSSARVRVTLDTAGLIDSIGYVVDGDGDGRPGGNLDISYQTQSLARIPGTEVWGYVYDAYRRSPDGSDIPVVGVTLRVDAIPELTAVTDETGRFLLSDVPVPAFAVHIDGSTAANAPVGQRYPVVGKAFHSVAGASTQLSMDGVPFAIYLPPMRDGDMVPLSASAPTTVGFGAGGREQLHESMPAVDSTAWDRLTVTFPAAAARDELGTPATAAAIIPVPTDRLPAPVPGGLSPPVVFSVQAADATRFAAAVSLTYPNLDGLPPGERSLIFSFNHDAGRWDVVGSGTVSADGETIVSDPGVSLLAPGWHFVTPGTQRQERIRRIKQNQARRKREERPSDQDTTEENPLPLCVDVLYLEARATALAIKGYFHAKGSPLGASHLSHFIGGSGAARFYGDDSELATQARASKAFTIDLDNALATSILLDLVEHLRAGGTVTDDVVQQTVARHRPTVFCFCPDTRAHPNLFWGIRGVQQVEVDGHIEHLVDPVKGPVLRGGLNYTFYDTYGFGSDDVFGPNLGTLARVANAHMRYLQLNCGARWFGVFLEIDMPFEFPITIPPSAGRTTSPAREIPISEVPGFGTDPYIYYRYRFDSGVEVAGKLYETQPLDVILPADGRYRAVFYAPNVNSWAAELGVTGASGSRLGIESRGGALYLTEFGGPDRDGDGVPDAGEEAIGTDPDNADSDGDGDADGVELDRGTDPLESVARPPGLIGAMTTARAVYSLDTVDDLAVLASDSSLMTVDISNPTRPAMLGSYVTGTLSDANDVSCDGRLALTTTWQGVLLLNLEDPTKPRLVRRIPLSDQPRAVVAYRGCGYIGGLDRRVHQISLPDGEILAVLELGEPVYALDAAAGRVAVLTDSHLTMLAAAPASLAVLGSVSHDRALDTQSDVFAAENHVYVSRRNGYDSYAISEAGVPEALGRDDIALFGPLYGLAFDGTSRVLACVSRVVGSSAIAVYDGATPATTNALLIEYGSPPVPVDLVLHNGLAFVANGSGGLIVYATGDPDRAGIAPSVELTAPTTAESEGRLALLTRATDDVRVQRVEFFLNGQRVATDYSYPFEIDLITPRRADQTSVTVQARAIDGGNNASHSDEIVVQIVDSQAGTVTATRPAAGEQTALVTEVQVFFSEPMDWRSIDTDSLSVTFAGDDETLDTGDDVVQSGELAFDFALQRVSLSFARTLQPGLYRGTVASRVTDFSGNAFGADVNWTFTVLDVQLAFAVPPTGTNVGVAMPEVEVQVRDTLGQLVTEMQGPITLSLVGAGRLFGATTSTAIAGVARFRGLAVDRAGADYRLQATATDLQSTLSPAFSIGVGEPRQLVFLTSPGNSSATGKLTGPPRVGALDFFGQPAALPAGTVTIELGNNPQQSRLQGIKRADTDGAEAVFADLNVPVAATGYSLRARLPGLASAVSATFAVEPGAAARLVILAAPTTASAGEPFGPVVVAVTDAAGNRLGTGNAEVALAVQSGPGGAPLDGVLTATQTDGTAQFTGLSSDRAGAYVLVATAAGLEPAVSAPLQVAPGPAAALRFTQQPSSLSVAATLTPAITVSAVDAFGNLVAAANATVTVALAGADAGLLTGTLTQVMTTGVATFADLRVTGPAATVTLRATSAQLGTVDSRAFSVAVTGPRAADLALEVDPDDGCLEVAYVLLDDAPATASVLVEFRDGPDRDWRRATPAPTAPGADWVASLTSTPEGVPHRFVWDATHDLPPDRYTAAELRLTPSRDGIFGSGVATGLLVVDLGARFATPVAVATLGAPADLIASDLDADGWPDLAVSDSSANAVVRLYQNVAAPGTFTAVSLPDIVGPGRLATGDVNGDGRPDLVVSCPDSAQVRVYLQSATDRRAYDPPVILAAAAGAGAPVIADLNADGRQDLAAANAGAGTVTVFLQSESGDFTAAVSYAVGARPLSLVSADFNRDGRPDLATANADDDSVSMLFQHPTQRGSFLTPLAAAAGAGPADLATLDVDGDGDLDLAVANTGDDSVSIISRGSDGSFAESARLTTGRGPTRVRAGDLDRDGRLDLLTLDGDDATATWRTARGAAATAVAANSTTAALFDLDRDGRLDLITAAASTGDVSVHYGTQLRRCRQAFAAVRNHDASRPYSAVLADLNGDGKADAVTDNFIASTIAVRFGDGAGGFGPATDYQFDSPFRPRLGDFNGDERPDIAVLDGFPPIIELLLQDAAAPGSFVRGVPVTVPANTFNAVSGDMNNDGLTDLILVGFGPNQVTVMIQDPVESSGFRTATVVDLTLDPGAIVVREVTDDGHLDVLVPHPQAGRISLFRGDGTGALAPVRTYAAGSGPIDANAADIDGDGRSDLAVYGVFDDTITLLLQDPQAPGDFLAGGVIGDGLAGGVGLHDVNEDGLADLIFPNIGTQQLYLWLNDADNPGSFLAADQIRSGRSVAQFALADLDGDGVVEVVTPTQSDNTLGVYALDATHRSRFVSTPYHAVEAPLAALDGGDFDGDGWEDIVVALTGQPFLIVLSGAPTEDEVDRRAVAMPAPVSALAALDANADGRLDLVATTVDDPPEILTLHGDGDGEFVLFDRFPLLETVAELVTADLDADGTMDVAARMATRVQVLQGRRNGGFVPHATAGAAGAPQAVAAADFNRDGIPDLALTIDATTAIHFGRGDATFADGIPVATGAARQLLAADLDGDGRAELVILSASTAAVEVWLGAGDGSFTAGPQLSLLGQTERGTLGDVDGDGWPDLVLAMSRPDQVSVFRGPTFAGADHYATGYASRQLRLVDRNRDGVMDLVLGLPEEERVRVFLGQ